MRTVIRVFLFPFAMIIDLITWLCVGGLSCFAFALSLASAVLSILAVITMLTGSVPNGLILVGFAVAVSPMGLPMLIAWGLSWLQSISHAIKAI